MNKTNIFVSESDSAILGYIPRARFFELYSQDVIRKDKETWLFEANGKLQTLIDLGFQIYLCRELGKIEPEIKERQIPAIGKKVQPKAEKKGKKGISIIKELQFAEKFIDKKQTIPVLNNFCFKLINDRGYIVVTDLETGYLAPIGLNAKKDFQITVNAKKFLEIYRKCDNPKLKQSDKWIEISDNHSSYKLVGELIDEYPSIPLLDFKDSIAIDANQLLAGLQKVVFACTQEDTRFALNGVYFEFTNNQLTVSATDAKRLAQVSNIGIQSNSNSCLCIQRIIPKRTIQLLIAFLKLYQPTYVDFCISKNHVGFHYQEKVIIARFIEGQYPNIGKIIPTKNEKMLSCNVQELADAVQSAALLANDRSHAVKVSLSQKKVKIGSINPEFGDSLIELKKFSYQGDDLIIGFDANLVLNFLSQAQKDDIAIIKFATEEDQVLFAIENQANYIYVVMPMRL